MSYNTRRGNNYNGRQMNNTPGRQNQNFVSGGQFKPNDRPLIQMPGQQTPNKMQQSTPQKGNYNQQSTPVFQTTNVTQQPSPAPTPLKSIMKPVKTETPAPVVTPAVQPAPVQVAPVATPVTAPVTPVVSAPVPQDTNTNDVKMEDGSEVPVEPKTKKFTPSGNKINKRELRIRRNRRVGMLVRPKNASMVLNELMAGQQLKFEELGTLNGLFGVSVNVDGATFEAYAQTKSGAKQKACENAIKGYIAKVVRNKQQARETVENKSGTQEDEDDSMQVDEANEDISWCQLASFALYKLMDSMQDMSEIQPEAIFQRPSAPKPGATPKPSKELPPNAAEIHPVMLLYQVRPGTVIEDVSSVGQAPNIVYTVKVEIDGVVTHGQGPNKKTARKNCAYAVMEKHYNIKYPQIVENADGTAAPNA